jgi:hypothetical protein
VRNLILFGLLIILLLAAQFATAKTVDEVIEKYIKARGGKARLAGVKRIFTEGIKNSVTGEMKIVVIREQDKLCRTELETSEAKNLVLITDQTAWAFFPLRSVVLQKFSDEETAALQTELDIAGPLVDYVAKGHQTELMGKEILDGSTCYKIKLTTNTGKRILFWIDVHSFLLQQSTAALSNGSETSDTVILYKDYRDVEGILFAHVIETKSNSKPYMELNGEISFSTILINPVINQTMYQLNIQS